MKIGVLFLFWFQQRGELATPPLLAQISLAASPRLRG